MGVSLLSDIEAAEASTRKGPRCSISIILDVLPPEDAAALRSAFAAGTPAKAISTALRANKHHITAETIRRHQRQDCSCR